MLRSSSRFTGVTYSNDDLVQSSQRDVSLINHKNGEKSNVCIDINISLPIYLCPKYWKRHGLSSDDLRYIFNKTPAVILWRLVLLLGMDLSSSSVRPSVSKNYDMIVSSKNFAVIKIFERLDLEDFFFGVTENVLQLEYQQLQQHVPILPVYQVDVSQYRQITSDPIPTWTCFGINIITNTITVKGILWAANRMEELGLCCIRLIDTSDYTKQLFREGSMLNKPMSVQYNNKSYFTVDEKIIVVCAR
jgi:hypothetical protein